MKEIEGDIGKGEIFEDIVKYIEIQVGRDRGRYVSGMERYREM